MVSPRAAKEMAAGCRETETARLSGVLTGSFKQATTPMDAANSAHP
jgi:hypothetical protein